MVSGSFNKICLKVFVADAAADEIKAGQTAQAFGSVKAVSKLGFRNLRHVLRDKTHASGRVLKRPFNADAFLAALMRSWVTSKTSPASIIQWSDVFSEHFNKAIQMMENSPVMSKFIRDLGFAKHRYNSLSKPLSRIILFFFAAFLETCQLVVQLRPNQADGKACEAFLQSLDVESCLQISMMADAADECNMFLRFTDKQDFDVSSLVSEIN